jgi:hypothetical protein
VAGKAPLGHGRPIGACPAQACRSAGTLSLSEGPMLGRRTQGRLESRTTPTPIPIPIPSKKSLNRRQKKGRFDPPTFFPYFPVFPCHRPDESRLAMSWLSIPEGLCLSVDTVLILAISLALTSAKTFQKKSLSLCFKKKILLFQQVNKIQHRLEPLLYICQLRTLTHPSALAYMP